MKTISIANHKGGVSITATSHALSTMPTSVYADGVLLCSAVGGDQIMKGPVRLVPEEAPGVSG